ALCGASDRTPHIAHQQRIHGKERDGVTPVRCVMEAGSRDLEIPARIVADEGVPEWIGSAQHAEALGLVVGKHHVGHERERRGDEAEPDRAEGDESRRMIPAQWREWHEWT